MSSSISYKKSTMKYPNLRYGNPREMAYYAQGRSLKELARELRRSERSVRDWLTGRERVPWWVPELLRLRDMEHDLRLRQMNIGRLAPSLGVVGEPPSNVSRLRPLIGDNLATEPRSTQPAADEQEMSPRVA
ncbi:hypothetical protein [Paraburkholderia sp. D1E]|uniref:hypothetical protein n=1 Tax=Paraburkholderia sp. D1E TaxID=3461398 RepID=UPI00404567D6